MTDPVKKGAVRVGPWVGGVIFLGVFAWALSGLVGGGGGPTGGEELFFYCGAGIRKPVEAAARAYEKEYNVKVQIQPGGSNTLLSNLQVSGRGDR